MIAVLASAVESEFARARKEDFSGALRKVQTMPIDEYDAEMLKEFGSMFDRIKGWPLDKRETFAALNMMGLTSRLQPLQLHSADQQKLIVELSFKLAAMAVEESEKK